MQILQNCTKHLKLSWVLVSHLYLIFLFFLNVSCPVYSGSFFETFHTKGQYNSMGLIESCECITGAFPQIFTAPIFQPLSTNLIKWSNTLKQFVGKVVNNGWRLKGSDNLLRAPSFTIQLYLIIILKLIITFISKIDQSCYDDLQIK